MDNFDDNEIGKLLRLKKYEQPPPGYFEDFLHEFHRRQRDELLREPLWSLVWQRISRFLLPAQYSLAHVLSRRRRSRAHLRRRRFL